MKVHNLLSLMLNLRFKTLRLVSSLIGREQGKTIIEKYDKQTLFPMFLKCYYHLHPLVEFERDVEQRVVEQNVEEDMSLDIFEMIASTSEPTTKLVNKILLIFKCYQVDVKDIKCPLQWWKKHENMFPTFGFCARQILRIVGFQIETKIIFSLVGILINLRRCCLQLKNLNKLIFVNKNWPNDLRIGCKSPFSLVDLIKTNLNLEEEFEKAFEKDEILELSILNKFNLQVSIYFQ
jgi:hypothetical protein